MGAIWSRLPQRPDEDWGTQTLEPGAQYERTGRTQVNGVGERRGNFLRFLVVEVTLKVARRGSQYLSVNKLENPRNLSLQHTCDL